MTHLTRRQSLALGLGAMLAPALARPAFAQAYPQRNIKLVVPRAAGGPLDVIGRQWAEAVRPSLGTVVIENMGAGGGAVGTMSAARAPADGYTILLGGVGELVINPLVRSDFSFDPVKDLAAISMIASLTCGICVAGDSPIRTLKDLAAHVRANGGKMSYGSAGTGTVSHLTGELFKHLAGTPDIVHVPYKGSAPAFVDLMSGNIPMMAFTVSGETIEFHRTGKIRILAVGSPERIAQLPDVPVGAEAGYPEFLAGNFLGLFAPAGTPKPVLDQIAAATAKVLSEPEFMARMAKQSYQISKATTPESATAYIAQELVKWPPIVRLAGLTKS